MSSEYINECSRESARALMPSGYLMLWQNAFQTCQGHHLRLADVLQCVDLIAWDNQRLGMGYRARRRGDYLVALQKPPIKARATWRTKPTIPDRWPEKVDRKLHPHIKPIGLISALIESTTCPADLVVDPAAGSFIVMHAARRLGREFIGCDLAASPWGNEAPSTIQDKQNGIVPNPARPQDTAWDLFDWSGLGGASP
jgi:site-specific DNA-methyltransferase (adenine-specific)